MSRRVYLMRWVIAFDTCGVKWDSVSENICKALNASPLNTAAMTVIQQKWPAIAQRVRVLYVIRLNDPFSLVLKWFDRVFISPWRVLYSRGFITRRFSHWCTHSPSFSEQVRQPWRDSVEFQCAALTSLCLIRWLPHDRPPDLCWLPPVPGGAKWHLWASWSGEGKPGDSAEDFLSVRKTCAAECVGPGSLSTCCSSAPWDNANSP